MNDFSNVATPATLTPESLGELFRILSQPYTPPRPKLIVSPSVMHLIETDPVVAEAARIVLGEGYRDRVCAQGYVLV